MRRSRLTVRRLMTAVAVVAIALSVSQGVWACFAFLMQADAVPRGSMGIDPAGPFLVAEGGVPKAGTPRAASALRARVIPLAAATFLLFAGATAWWARLIWAGCRAPDVRPFEGPRERRLIAALRVLAIGYGLGLLGVVAMGLFALATLGL